MQQEVGQSLTMQQQQVLCQWIQLTLVPALGPAGIAKLRQTDNWYIGRLFAAGSQQLQQLGFNQAQVNAILQPDVARVQSSLDWLHADKRHFILTPDDPDYPSRLTQISSPPVLLYGIGDKAALANPQIAIVGSRNPSESGKSIARHFARQLSEMGWTVTSGLALGVDGFAHSGALDAQKPTIAVMGTGLGQIYPKRHIKLAEHILAAGGVLLSEFAPHIPAKPENFPRRNRIISGLSLGTLIVEAALKSGSLITARYALEQNREIFAVPGNINNPLAQGCHYLIQQGAKLVTSVADIIEEFAALNINSDFTTENKSQKNSIESLARDRLLDSVDFEATPLDIVAERSGITVSEVMSQLLEYELRGLVTAVPGGYIKLGEK